MAQQTGGAGKTTEVKVDSTLSKGLSILETLVACGEAKGVTEVSRELDMTKSNAFRLLRSLVSLGYVKHGEGRSYMPTLKIWRLGQALMESIDLPKLAAPQMHELSGLTGEAIYLAVQDGLSVIYIDKIDSRQPIRSFTPKGGSAPIHCVGAGKAILAERYEAMREMMKGNLTKFTDKTLTSLARLDKDMELTRARGYSIDYGEYRERVMSFGAAIKDPGGGVLAALGVSVPEVNLKVGQAQEICKAVKDGAEKVEAALRDI